MFGLADVSTTPATGYMEVVPQRNATTLLPIIQAHVAPGTVIHSDQWAAYNQTASLPNVSSHSTVNRSVTFVDPATGTHTQNWNHVKRKLKRMKGCHAHQRIHVAREEGTYKGSAHARELKARFSNFAGGAVKVN